jgi:hypothetical protein
VEFVAEQLDVALAVFPAQDQWRDVVELGPGLAVDLSLI